MFGKPHCVAIYQPHLSTATEEQQCDSKKIYKDYPFKEHCHYMLDAKLY